MVHDDSNSLPMFFFDDFDLIEIMQNPAIYSSALSTCIHTKIMYVVVFSEEKSPELLVPINLPNQHADFGENEVGESPLQPKLGRLHQQLH